MGFMFTSRAEARGRAVVLMIIALLGVFAGVSVQKVGAAPLITVGPDDDGQETISVGGSNQTFTLEDIRAALATNPAYAGFLTNAGTVWTLNRNLVIKRDVTLNLTPATVTELRLRSGGGAAGEPCGNAPKPTCDYSSFVYLRTNDGTINVAGTGDTNRVRIYSWDGAAVDTNYSNGRAYILAKYDATLNFNFADVGYLGSGDGESYGVAWRDIDSTPDSNPAAASNTRVTGNVQNSLFHNNYYGVYTFQAAGMSFVNNRFYQNIQYGFDPHDFTHNVLVQDNWSYENGSHGFIISRGCTDFQFINNKSFNNNNTADPSKLAHGFMLDPGAPDSNAGPVVPSTNNTFTGNEAYGNEGYGLRILGSNDNTITGNNFHNNQTGITLEEGSTGNTLTGNTLSGNNTHGIFVRGTADGNTLTNNNVSGNTANGIYVKSNNNTVSGNTASNSTTADGINVQPETTVAQAIADLTEPGTVSTEAESSPENIGTVVAQATLSGNKIVGNTVASNTLYGVDLRSVSGTLVQDNVISGNTNEGVYLTDGTVDTTVYRNQIFGNRKYGIKVNGVASTGNTITQNAIYNNTLGPIAITAGANGGIKPPQILSFENKTITGTAPANSKVEVFSDPLGQGRYYEGSTTADSSGNFTFTKAGNFQAINVNVTATDAAGNTSAFGVDVPFEGNTIRTFLPLVFH